MEHLAIDGGNVIVDVLIFLEPGNEFSDLTPVTLGGDRKDTSELQSQR